MKKSTARSAWSWLREYWLSPRRIRFWVAAVAILYTVLGFLVLPWLATAYAVNVAEDDLGRDLRIETVRTNPFTLTLEIEDLALDDFDGHELVGFERLFVDVAWSSLWEWTTVIPAAQLEGARVHEEQFDSGGTRFTRLLGEFQRRPLPRAGPDEAIIRPIRTDGAAPVALHDIDFSLEDFILADGAVAPFQVSGRFDLGGAFAFDGSVQLLPALDLAGTLDVDDVALALAEPFAQRIANIRVDSGSLSTEGELRSGPDDPLTYAGSARIDALDIGEREGGEDVVGWQALTIDEIDFGLGTRSLELSVIRLEGPSARVFIAEDRSTNLGELLVDQPAAAEPAQEQETEPFDIVIGGLRLDGGVLAFTDRSLPLPFATRVQQLSGGISRLAPGQEEPARVDLQGQVADYGQARIDGELNPWNPLSSTRVDLVLENLDIPELTPYAVQFAGRRIAAGRMDLDLGYVLDDGRLDARNSIVLRDLQLGERFEHPNATNLPLGLAIALLKDSDGVISVDIPVQGNVNDPEFSFGPAIRQALTDILKDIVSSPFNLLASIVGGDPDELAKVAFAPGSSEIPPPQRERLDQLRSALEKRPELAIELPGPYAPELDRPALQRQRARAALVERLDEAGVEVANPSLSAADTRNTLEAMFADRYPRRSLAEVRERFTTAESDEEPEFDAAEYREHLAAEVSAAEEVTEEDLAALAQARADAVRSYILGEGDPSVEPGRVRWLAPAEVEADDSVVLEIGLDAQ
ncbi:DUF748 domain-containing protein [Halofilum ochraceum]|uniref:DUF748 domain-containing protein n=1 Tax=Halofilum ochraceum TaxID=1611323 RepID=UPI0008DA9B92|nr:DUF748 domain-containing protein [Halofilum ochraceum]